MTEAPDPVLTGHWRFSSADALPQAVARGLAMIADCERTSALLAEAVDALNDDLAIVGMHIEAQCVYGAAPSDRRLYSVRCRGETAPAFDREATLSVGPDGLQLAFEGRSEQLTGSASLAGIELATLSDLLMFAVETLTRP